jgi:23S rRNA (pseudouridine1915-N3)-methyltransferase
MKLSIVSFLKHTRTGYEESEAEFSKRISPHAEVELVAVKKWNDDTGIPERLLKPGGMVIGLFVDGKQLTSPEMALRLQAMMNSGQSHPLFVIGGPEGMPRAATAQVTERWSLSALTFSHGLARLVLLEALYRAFDILHGGRYHK